MNKREKQRMKCKDVSPAELSHVHGGSGSNTVFVRRNGETGILRPDAQVMGGMGGGTGIGG